MPLIKLNNTELYYETYGEGEPILFLHGLGSSTQDWERQVEDFSKEYKVYLLDLRGHGNSSKNEEFTFESCVKDVETFIKEVINKPFHLVGLSLGAMIASAVSNKEIELKSLTLINCPLKMQLDNLKIKIQFYLRLIVINLFGMRTVAKLIAPKLFPKEDQKKTRELFINRWEANDKKSYIDSMKAIIGFDISKYTQNIECKTFIISAQNDYFDIKEKEEYSKQIRNSELIEIKDTHHALPFESPMVFNKILLKKLNTLK